jgi:DNA-binding FadR family transcriptional regulator
VTVNDSRRLENESQLRIPKIADLAAQELRRQIVRHELAEGDALPSESALMKHFGISRPTLREAFRVLESEGLIKVRRGAHGGARVQTPNREAAARYAGLVLEYRGTTLEDVYDARNVIEPPCAALLARRRTRKDLKLLQAALDEARDTLDDPIAATQRHNDFHALVIELAGNETMTLLNGIVQRIIDVSSWEHTARSTSANDRANRKAFQAHERLVQHIVDQDAEAAHEQWRQHVSEAERYMLTGLDAKTVLDLLG